MRMYEIAMPMYQAKKTKTVQELIKVTAMQNFFSTNRESIFCNSMKNSCELFTAGLFVIHNGFCFADSVDCAHSIIRDFFLLTE